jgi:hypothetical protein
MQRALRALSIVTVAAWLFCTLSAASVLLSLARYRPLHGFDMPSVVVPLVGLAASAWLGFARPARASVAVRFTLVALLLLLGCFLLVVLIASRAG